MKMGGLHLHTCTTTMACMAVHKRFALHTCECGHQPQPSKHFTLLTAATKGPISHTCCCPAQCSLHPSQVVPTQGFPVRSGAVYTLRMAIANSLTSTFDSAILVPFKSLTLAAPGTAAAGGPYSAVS
jgi:hypothetical protein